MNKIEEYFLNSRDTVVANDEWISDSYITISKKFIFNKFLKAYKCENADKLNLSNHLKNVLADRKGENINYIKQNGAECFLGTLNRIFVKIKDNFSIDYDYLKMIVNSYCVDDFVSYEVETCNEKGLIIEMKSEDDIIGYIMAWKFEDGE